LAGHGLVLKQYRNGAEVTPPIDQDLHYDFNFQQIRTIPSRKIYPGDKLELTCKYRTQNRNSTVFGGLGTYQEMCLTFLFYYPRSPVTYCTSSPKLDHLLPALKYDRLPSVNPSSLFRSIKKELQDPNYPWHEDSRIKNLVNFNEASRLNSSYQDHICSASQAIINTQPTERPTEGPTEEPTEGSTSGSHAVAFSSFLTVLAATLLTFTFHN
jgi:hypothetical protein